MSQIVDRVNRATRDQLIGEFKLIQRKQSKLPRVGRDAVERKILNLLLSKTITEEQLV